MITWTPYPQPKFYAAEYAEAHGLVLVAGHDGSWSVWKMGGLDEHAQALLRGEKIERTTARDCRSSSQLYPLPNSAKNLDEAKRAAEAAFNEMITTTA